MTTVDRALFAPPVDPLSGAAGAERFFSLSPDLLAVMSLDGRLRQINPTWETLLDTSADHLLQVSAAPFVHPDDRARLREVALRLAGGGGDIRDLELRLVPSEGVVRHVVFNASWNAEDRLAYVVGRDVTEQREAERARDDARARAERIYRDLVRNLPDAMLALYDGRMHCLLADGPVLGREGLSREDVEGRTLQEAETPERFTALEPHFRAALAGEHGSLDLRSRHGDRLHHLEVAPVRRPDGEVRGVLCVTRDVTDRRDLQRSLHESEAELARVRAAFDGLSRRAAGEP